MQYILSEEEYNDLVPKEKYYYMMDKVGELNKKVLELQCDSKCKKEHGGYCDFCPISVFGTDTCMDIQSYSK